ncbi:MAG: imidazole glycerol phosphate synthase subunit HisF [Anaerovoracaceae bacterium]|jgi:cyclase
MKKIIPCLDVKEGKVVKGMHFNDIKYLGDPVECAKAYEQQGADELVMLDISATVEGRGTMIDMVKKLSRTISIPLIVGGGVKTLEDFHRLFEAGADRVSINSSGVNNPQLIRQAADRFDSHRIILAIDGKRVKGNKYNVFISGGKIDTGLDIVQWAIKCEELGAGEILLTSMDADGVKDGFDLEMINAVCQQIKIPVIASGGCGSLEHIIELFEKTAAGSALAASVFHYGQLTVSRVKEGLREAGIPVIL